jgi:hypothetical protein
MLSCSFLFGGGTPVRHVSYGCFARSVDFGRSRVELFCKSLTDTLEKKNPSLSLCLLLIDKTRLRDYAISRVNPNPRQVFLM